MRDFDGDWTGTGTVTNPGAGDSEMICLEAGEYMISPVVHTGTVNIEIAINVYQSGDSVDIDYRHGATPAACEAAAWSDYSGPFVSLGYAQARLTSTL